MVLAADDLVPPGNDATPSGVSAPARSNGRPSPAWRLSMWVAAGLAMAYSLIVLSTAARTPNLGFVSQYGGPILAVTSGSGAETGGLSPGDRITSVNDVPTRTPAEVTSALAAIAVDATVEVTVERDGAVHRARFTAAAERPIASAVAAILAVILLALAFSANRSGSFQTARSFFREAIVLVVLLTGTFAPHVVMGQPALAVIWYASVALIGPCILHFMAWFPVGSGLRSRAAVAAAYGPGVLLAALLTAVEIHANLAGPTRLHQLLWLCALGLSVTNAAVCLCIGATQRTRRMRGGRVAPEARRWLLVSGWSTALPLVAGAIWAGVDLNGFVSGGFRTVVAASAIGGTTFVVLALNHASLGALARPRGRYRAHLASTAIAGGLFLALCLAATSSALEITSTDLSTAGIAALAAALVFGPLRSQIERDLERRLARDRKRRRELLRCAAEAALATLDLGRLCEQVASDTRTALDARAVVLLHWLDETWSLQGRAGPPADVDRLVEIGSRVASEGGSGVHRVWVREPATVVVPVASESVRSLLIVELEASELPDADQIELLTTLASQLAVAMSNAHTHCSVVQLHERLEVEHRRALASKREISRLKDQIAEENRRLIERLRSAEKGQPVIGPGLAPTFASARRVAREEATVLITGETGVGKELIARAIHGGSDRADGPFVVVDCGAIPSGLAESVLFGHMAGSFTGAIADSPGAFRSAEGGTLFLDEIGELAVNLQPTLLRALQERDVQPVGATSRVPIDVRIIAGTHRDLDGEVRDGRFRQDLLYRLKVFEISVPPLRERRGDIGGLVCSFLDEFAERGGSRRREMSDEAMSALCAYDWPGNVRELRHTVEAAAILATGEQIGLSDLPMKDALFNQRAKQQVRLARGTGLQASLNDLEKERLEDALREHDGNRTRAARALGMSRGALLRRMKRYGLSA